MIQDTLRIDTRTVGPVGVLEIAGTLAPRDVPQVRAALSVAWQASPHRTLVCDVSELDVLGETSILTVFPAALRYEGGWPRAALHLAGAGPDLARRLRTLRMERYLPLHGTLPAAVQSAELDLAVTCRTIDLEPDPLSLRIVRQAVRDLGDEGLAPGREATLLVANELAANAIRHAATPFTLTMTLSPWRTLVAVSDPSRQEPAPRPLRRASVGGRGMHVVISLAREWGVRLVHPRGKTVWASLAGPVTRLAGAR